MRWIICAVLWLAPAAHAVDGVIEINHTSIVAAGGYPFTIGAPGSYVLTGNLASPSSVALHVTASNVDLDLNGFTIDGAGLGTAGILVVPPAAGITLRGGTIANFGGSGVLASAVSDLKLFKMRIADNGGGVTTAADCLVVESSIIDNSGIGLNVSRCRIENSVIRGNGATGISGDSNVILHNVISMNGALTGTGGVFSAFGSTLEENQMIGNTGFGFSDTLGSPPGPVFAPPVVPFPVLPPASPAQILMKNVIDGSPMGIGIYVAGSALITDNVVARNAFDGIVCGCACTVRGNKVTSNNPTLGGNGGMTIGPGSTVSENSVSFNTGIGAVLDPTAGYMNNTFHANIIQDVSVTSPATWAPHPTSGFGNLCTGFPGPVVPQCP